MRVRRRHVLHIGVVLAVLPQLGFATAFLVDAHETNKTYDALAGHRVTLTAHTLGCAFVGRPARTLTYTGHICRVSYSYQGQEFISYIPFGQTETFYVDPLNTALRMNKVSFDKGPEETTGDIVIAVLLLLGALIVTTLHQIHLRRGWAR